MNQHDEQLSTKFGDWLAAFLFGALAVLVCLGGPLTILMAEHNRSLLRFACGGVLACALVCGLIVFMSAHRPTQGRE